MVKKSQSTREAKRELREARKQLALAQLKVKMKRTYSQRPKAPVRKTDPRSISHRSIMKIGPHDWKTSRTRMGSLWMFLRVNAWEVHVIRMLTPTPGGEHVYNVSCCSESDWFTEVVQCAKTWPEAKALNSRRIAERLEIVFKMKAAPRKRRPLDRIIPVTS